MVYKTLGKKMKKVFLIIAFIFTANAANAINVTIESPKIRLMPPGANMTAGYFNLSNQENKEKVLVGAKSNFFKHIEIHQSMKDGDVMKMVKKNFVSIPPNSELEFKPMGYHLMLMQPIDKILENQNIKITLSFASGENIDVQFVTKKMNKMKMAEMDMENDSQCSDMDMGGMKMGNMMKNMSRPDYVFPVGVKGGKNMMPKKIMFGYKYGYMDMGCCKDSTSTVGQSFIKGLGFTMAPTDMEMDMHMFSAMYAVNNKFTVMSMLPYVKKEMQMQKISGMNTGKLHKTSSSGIGDLSIAGLYKYSGKSTIKLSLSLPTADDDEKDLNMMGALKTLPYPMQIGSGTYDVTLGYSYQNINQDWSYGAQLNFVKRFDYNSEDWKYGDRREASLWVAKPISNFFSFSLGLDAEHQDNVKGKSSQRNNNTPTWNEYYHSHFRVSANIGLNFRLPKSKSRIGLQCGKPIYEDVDGPQMSPDFKCNFGVSTMM
tara:strand:+ start:1053 stop:2510 length:1458 start_codon:yes stop_codon:yes gene_type:complete